MSKRLHSFSGLRALAVALALVVAAPSFPTHADARAGGGASFGSRGMRTFSAPAFTRTAPYGAEALQRTETPQPSFGAPGPRRFGFGAGLATGLLGAGLFGLFGAGLFGGLFKLILFAALIMLVLRLVRGRAGGPLGAPVFRSATGFGGGPGFGRASSPGGPARPTSVPLTLAPQDFDAFEGLLVDIQTAYGREDLATLSRLATPEMVRGFARDLEQNRARGLHNDVGEARLVQGDLAEAWREGATDYATVAMRFTLRDLMVERASGRIVGGDASRTQEATELWTFRRDGGGPWRLSALQQRR